MVEVIYGTSLLGNLYEDIPYDQKREIVREIFLKRNDERVTFDCAGKYGAGLALETLGKILTDLHISSKRIKISNKLGWRRKPLLPGQIEPTFERNIWKNLQHDAVLDISYDGIMNAYHEGNELLGNYYKATLVSIHDPDEYLHNAIDESDLLERMTQLSEAYRALFELKSSGEVESVGVGSKDYKIIQYISNKYPLDWVMTACNLTPFIHPSPHLVTLQSLSRRGVRVINSAVFNSGFLLGGEFFNYQRMQRGTSEDPETERLFQWRDLFHSFCQAHSLSPTHLCIQFSALFPFVNSIALNAGSVEEVQESIRCAEEKIPIEIWRELQRLGLLSSALTLHQLDA